ncbi:hypothetical protein G6F66_015380 [Rhizopus arrhizus]|nr:hypothetical protein G6F66_015380 [Rhizopus arrhizus]
MLAKEPISGCKRVLEEGAASRATLPARALLERHNQAPAKRLHVGTGVRIPRRQRGANVDCRPVEVHQTP